MTAIEAVMREAGGAHKAPFRREEPIPMPSSTSQLDNTDHLCQAANLRLRAVVGNARVSPGHVSQASRAAPVGDPEPAAVGGLMRRCYVMACTPLRHN